jgi:chromosome segregation ATPase
MRNSSACCSQVRECQAKAERRQRLAVSREEQTQQECEALRSERSALETKLEEARAQHASACQEFHSCQQALRDSEAHVLGLSAENAALAAHAQQQQQQAQESVKRVDEVERECAREVAALEEAVAAQQRLLDSGSHECMSLARKTRPQPPVTPQHALHKSHCNIFAGSFRVGGFKVGEYQEM